MTATNESDFFSKILQTIDEICNRYGNVLTRFESKDEEDDEERWILKETTKNAVTELEKQTIPTTKQTILLIRALNSRMRTLIEKCVTAFPQLEELVRLRSLQVEMDALLDKAPTNPPPKCPMCLRLGSSQLFGKGSAGEADNVFLFVADKIGITDGGGVTGKESIPVQASPPAASPEQFPPPAPPSSKLPAAIDDDLIRSDRPRRSRKSEKMKRDVEGDITIPNVTSQSDTDTTRTPTVRSEGGTENSELRKDLLWMDDDDDKIGGSRSDRPRARKRSSRRRRSSRRSIRKRTEKYPSSPPRKTDLPPDYGICFFCPPDEGPRQHQRKQTVPAVPSVAADQPVVADQPERSIDLLGTGSSSSATRSREEERPRCSHSKILTGLVVVISFNLIILFSQWLFTILTSTTTWPGSALWPSYCNGANRLCRAGYDFACSDYCASRLERFRWGKK